MATALTSATSAVAGTFCVELPGTCAPANDMPTVDAAIAAAKASSGDDIVEVGEGTFTSAAATGFNLTDPAGSIELVGRGAGKTVLTAPTGLVAGGVVVSTAGEHVVDVTVRIPANANDGITGLYAQGGATVERVEITAGTTSASRVGLRLFGAHAASVVIDLAGDSGANWRGAELFDDASLRDAEVEAIATGVRLTSTAALRRARITARTVAELGPGTPIIEDSLLRIRADNGRGVRIFSVVDETSAGIVDGVTIDGADRVGSRGVSVAAGVGGSTVAATISSSVISRVPTSISVFQGNSGSAAVAVDHSCWEPSSAVVTGVAAAITTGEGNLPGCAPGFRDPGTGGFRPRADSVLVDAGRPLMAGSMRVDLVGSPRSIDGDGDGDPIRDIGAIEHASVAPTVTASASTATTVVQTPVTFSATASDDDLGDDPQVRWAFQDGTTVEGATATRSFATPGPQLATVTARDRAGLVATSVVSVDVVAGAPTVGAEPPPVAPPPAIDRRPPALSEITLTKAFRAGRRTPARITGATRSGLLRLRSSESSALRMTVQKKKAGRWVRIPGHARVALRRGINRIRFEGRLVGRRTALSPRSYRLVLRATDAAGNQSLTYRRAFRIVAASRRG